LTVARSLARSTLANGVRGRLPRQWPRVADEHELLARRADSLRIWVSTSPNNSAPQVQQFVVRRVLADHEVRVRVVPLVFVDVMDVGTVRQEMPERLLSDQDVQ
jgi:hypothetical protein